MDEPLSLHARKRGAGGLEKISIEDSERLQNDILSIPARRLAAHHPCGCLREMEKLQGTDAKAWQWGKLHHNF